MFEKNVGGLDRQLRFVAGVVLLVAGVGVLVSNVAGPVVALLAFASGAGLLFNAVTQFCLMNKLFGIDTCSRSG